MSDTPNSDDGKVVRLDEMRKAVTQAKPRSRKKSGGGGPPRSYDPPPTMLPPDCPVKPLGYDGLMYHFLAADGQRISLMAEKIGRNNILALFGGEEWLIKYVPAYDKNGIPNGEWKHGRLSPLLISACQRVGLWSPMDKERGVGCWLEGEETLVFHCGDILVTSKGRSGTGLRGGYLYPGAPRLPEPILEARESRGADLATQNWGPEEWAQLDGPGARIMERLVTWNFARPDLDPMLILGQICCALLGAAPDWRPMMVVTGDSRTGKSTLLKGIKAIIGHDALVSSGNATQAAIARKVGNTTKPVILDELERSEDNRRAEDLLELVVLASSGETLDRGTPGTETNTFQARNCFIMSAINLPGMKPQLLNRIFVIELHPLALPDREREEAQEEDEGETPLESVWGPVATLERLGRELRGRLLKGWPRWRQTLGQYQRALRAQGHDRRSADQFGTALTAYDLAMFDEMDGARVRRVATYLGVTATNETAGQRSMQELCLSYMLEQETSITRGGKQYTIANLLRRCKSDLEVNLAEKESEARQMLSHIGIKLFRDKRYSEEGNQPPHWTVAIATQHAGTARLFTGTQWHQRAGQSSGHADMLRRLPGAETHNNNGSRLKLRIEGRPVAVVFLPYDTIFPEKADTDESTVMSWRDEMQQ